LTILGMFHTACGALALILGLWIFVRTNGTRTHVQAGWAYVVCIVCLDGSALELYDLTGGFNIFYALALFSLAMVAAGVLQVLGRRRWRKWMWRHYQYMSWSYVGLVAATCNEAFVRVPPLQRLAAGAPKLTPLLVMSAIVAISGTFIFRMQGKMLARYGGAGLRRDRASV
jgi:uncharacterized membrane protein